MDLKELKKLCKAATPGPWKNDCGNGQVETERYRVLICERVGNSAREEDVKGMYAYSSTIPEEIKGLLSYDNEDDMDFIAAARVAVPQLIDEVERLQAEKEERNKWVKNQAQILADLQLENERLKERVERGPGGFGERVKV